MSGLVKAVFGGVASLFGFGDDPPSPPAYQPPPDPSIAQKAIEEANAEVRRKARAAGGRSSTNPTGGLGDTTTAKVSKTTLGA